MSMMLMVKAMQMKVGNPLRKLVLLKLADNANDKGECWPSYQHIAEQCEIARSTVKNHVRDLEEAGLLKRVFRKEGTKNKSNIFVLTLDEVANTPMGGSGDDLGQQMPEVGQEITEGGSGDDLGVGHQITPEPVTLEPVNEPVIETKDTPPDDGNIPEPKEEKFNGLKELIKRGADKQRAKDLISNRKTRRLAVLTLSIVDHMETEANKAGLSLAEVVELCSKKGWGGFEARYYQESKPVNQSSHDLSTQDYSKNQDRMPQFLIDAENERLRKLGVKQ